MKLNTSKSFGNNEPLARWKVTHEGDSPSKGGNRGGPRGPCPENLRTEKKAAGIPIPPSAVSCDFSLRGLLGICLAHRFSFQIYFFINFLLSFGLIFLIFLFFGFYGLLYFHCSFMFTFPNFSHFPSLVRYYFNRNDCVKNWVKFYLFSNFTKKVWARNHSEWLKNDIKLA